MRKLVQGRIAVRWALCYRIGLQLLCLILLTCHHANSVAAETLFSGQLSLAKYQLLTKTKSGNETEYEYRAYLLNQSVVDLSEASAVLSSPPANVTVLTGSLTFPAVNAGGQVASSNTFKLRSKKPPKLKALVWTLSGPDFELIEPKVQVLRWLRVKRKLLKASNEVEEIYTAKLVNLEANDLQSVTVNVADSRLTFPEGNSLSFTDLAPGEKAISNDRITVRYPRSVKFKSKDFLTQFSWNYAPVANAGSDQQVAAGADVQVSLDGSQSSDRDGDMLSYSWTLAQKPANSAAALSDVALFNPTLGPIDLDGDYRLTLSVNDGHADSAADTVVITTGDPRPVANAGVDQAHAVKSTVTLDGSASTGVALSYQWKLLSQPNGSRDRLKNDRSATPSLKLSKPGTYRIQLTVSNTYGSSKPDIVEITTGSLRPTAVIDPQQQNATIGDSVELSGEDSQFGQNSTPAYRWSFTHQPDSSATGFDDASAAVARFVPDLPGDYIAQLIVNDGLADSDPATARITATGGAVVTVPNLVGQTRAAAESQLTDLGLLVGTETFEHSDSVADGLVINQTPAADSVSVTGNSVELTISLGPDAGLPPNPDTVATKVETVVASNTFQTSQFLYSGDNPVQTGVEDNAIAATRAAVISGRVLNKAGEALEGVTISILDHAELGQTQSRSDGRFDMAVNGGGALALTYVKTGYLPGQRSVDVPWQTGVTVEDVTLVAQDNKVSSVDLTDTEEAIQVAQSSAVSDKDGTRQATLMIPQGTQAHIFNEDGSTQTVNSLNLRLTEYTAGDNGEASMPGALPATSAYTYAFEMKADEADVKIDGKDVMFDSPVPFYIDNFLDFPVGSIVPVGYYNKDKGVWVPSQNGKVIKILTITDGKANLDTDGDQQADDAATLAALNITDAERQKLANLYPDGNRSLWRVQVTHLSTWDCNWPYRMPDDAEQPQNPPPDNPDGDKPDDPCKTGGSIIECENQILGESIPLTGTTMSLQYASDRVPGRQQANTLNIPLSGATVPASLKRIDLEIYLAGRKFEHSAEGKPNQKYTFTWDGKDGYGRKLSGAQKAKIRIGFAYDPVYSTPAELQAAFARFTGVPLEGSRARNEVRIWQEMEVEIGAWDYQSQGMGGWSLSGVHVYDPNGKVLYLGNGNRAGSKQTFQSLISTLAGTGSAGLAGDGGQAKQARLNSPAGIAVHPDGSVYVADTENGRIRRIATDGSISTFAGTTPGFSGDGGQAAQAQLNKPESLAFALDGSLYVADSGNSRIRRIAPNGVISTVVGTGTPGFSGDNGPATEAKISYPKSLVVAQDGNLYFSDVANHRIRQVGTDGLISTIVGNGQAGFGGDGGSALQAKVAYPEGMAITGNGVIYVADSGNHRIRRISPDGVITTFAGSTAGFSGDGGQAKQARLYYPSNIALGRDGSLFVSDSGNDRIRRISPDGLISTIVGNGQRGFAGDNGPAAQAVVNYPGGMAVGADGRLYVSDNQNHRVRRISQSLDGFTNSDIYVASSDGSVLYRFDAFGRHLSTLHTLTGATLQNMGYDSAGRLISVTDANGNVTSLERNSAGNVVSITAPFGQKTSLSYDSNGYLAKVSNPAEENYQMAYGNGGLLTEFTNPRGYKSLMTYDELGRLLKDQDAAGGSQTLVRKELTNGFQVIRTTGLERVFKYSLQHLATGEQKRSIVNADGTVTDTVKAADGTIVTTLADGTSTQILQGPDPRFAMQVPIIKSAILTTGGVTSTVSSSRSVSLGNSENPLSLTSMIDTLTVNGSVFTSTYTAATKTYDHKSAENRQASVLVDELGRTSQIRITGLHSENYAYDEYGRLSTVTQGSDDAERKVSYQYNDDGYLASVIDPLARKISYSYDNAGHITTESLPDGRQIAFEYDENGNLTSITPPGRPAHIFKFTDVDLNDEYTPPDLGEGDESTVYAYNLDKQLTKITRPDGNALNLTYDSAGRLAGLTVPEGDFIFAYNASGQISSVTTPDSGKLEYTFSGSLLTQTAVTGVVAGSVGFTYNNDLHLSSVFVNGADSIDLEYDKDGLLTRAGSLELTRSSQNGLLNGTVLGEINDSFQFSGFGELVSYEAKNGDNSLFKQEFTRDKLGRITHKAETVGDTGHAYDYAYDMAGHLIEVKKNGVVVSSYTYDTNGNRLSSNIGGTVATGTYDDQDRLLSYAGATYSYTLNGELAAKTVDSSVTKFTYDVLGNLTRVVTADGTTIDYIVDGQNRRIGKKVNGVLTQAFLWQSELQPSAQLDGNGNVVSRFVYATGFNVPDYMIKGGKEYRFIKDNLGSPRLVVDVSTGSVVQELDYDEFGRVVKDTNPGFQPFGYAGGLYEPSTGLLRFGARDYDSFLGRWLSKDPILFNGDDTNLYLYVGQNPVDYVDPSGEIGIVGFFVGAGVEIGIQAFQNYMAGCDLLDIDNYDWWDVGVSGAVGAFAPGWGSVGKTAWKSGGAIRTLSGQLAKARTANRRAKVAARIANHRNQIRDALKVQGAYQGAKAVGKKLNGNGAGDDCGCKK
ncbi:RHS repeat-associated core domain-containing protein [Methylomonas sp. HYX-M1]|uniref:NHL domain-containing protein n=1 Tax=Methylomonas sp. HYX-M1 TaxID=3139307 RepID=UPI00345B8B39